MRGLAVRCQHEATWLCAVCGEFLTFLASHVGHGHTPWG